jgi:uncharacterized protein
MDSRITVRDNTEAGTYDAVLEDRVVGTIVYELRDHRMVLRHTVVDPEFRGQGIARALAGRALDDLAATGRTLTNYCGFVADYIQRNPRYARLVDADQPGWAHPRDSALRAAEQTPDAASGPAL